MWGRPCQRLSLAFTQQSGGRGLIGPVPVHCRDWWSDSCSALRQAASYVHVGVRERAGEAEGRVGQAGELPQVEEHVGLLVQNHLDVAGMDQGIIHLIPQSIACLKQHRV